MTDGARIDADVPPVSGYVVDLDVRVDSAVRHLLKVTSDARQRGDDIAAVRMMAMAMDAVLSACARVVHEDRNRHQRSR